MDPILQVVLFFGIALRFHSSAATCNGVQCLRQLLQAESSTGEETGGAQRFPFVADVIPQNPGDIKCGGALIGPGLVITAAQCITSSKSAFPNVILSHSGDKQVFQTCKTIVHEKFVGDPASGNDVALLFLAEESTSLTVSEGGPFQPRSVGSLDLTALQWTEGDSVEVIGMQIVGSDSCEQIGAGGFDITRMICTHSVVEGSCHDKIGAPILAAGNPDYGEADELVGILSGGDCETPGAPHVYTSISGVLDWISTLGTESSIVQLNPKCDNKDEEKVVSNRGGQLPIFLGGVGPTDAKTILALIASGDFKSAASLIIVTALTKDGPKILADVAQSIKSEEQLISAARAFVFSLDGLEALLARPMAILSQELSKKDISTKINDGELNEAAREVAELSKIDGLQASTVVEEVATEEIAGGRTVDMGFVLVDAVNVYDGKEEVLNPAMDVVLENL